MTSEPGADSRNRGAEAPEVIAPEAEGPAPVMCEHASNHIPARYARLGLNVATRESHAAWDPDARDLSPAARAERIESVYRPFCAAVEGLIAARLAAGRPTAPVTVHSFTPTWFGTPRRTEIGILHDADTRPALASLRDAERPSQPAARGRHA